MTHPIELLAPAGSLPVALAALDAGADAVYCGMKKFNARERSDNFSYDDMSRLIAYAHKAGRKVYVTRMRLRRLPNWTPCVPMRSSCRTSALCG